MPRVIVVAKRTAYGTLVETQHDRRAMQLLARRDPSVAGLRAAHEEHRSTLNEVLAQLRALGCDVERVRDVDERFDTRGVSLVVTVGGDGTLLTASHSVGAGLPVLGVNSSPSTSVGYFCSLSKDRCGAALRAALRGRVRAIDLTRMQVRVGSRLVFKRVLNDALFCHASPAATSRYIVQLDGAVEVHKSSGFWVGPAAGSTAAQRSAGGRVLALGSDALQLVVREPFTFTGRLRFARTLVPAGHEIVVVSKMTEGRLFIDGPQLVHEVRLGERISFARSDEPLRVLGISARHRRPV